MTDRIYYTDSECRSFEATVTRPVERDGRAAVVLDRTAFYPTSGGQPFDQGRLGDVDVLETMDEGDDIVHVVSAPIPSGTRVHGEIDWTRRFDHMQQHSGQHVLSAAFEKLFANRTMSFHMGTDSSTIDLAREAPVSEIDRAVDEANRVVWENHTVSVRFVSAEEASRLQLRKEPGRDGTLRLVEIADVDLSACGGTHVARTGAIGMIGVLGAERFRGGSRVTFVCGGRASRILRSYRDAIAGSVRVLSVLPDELPAALEKMQLEAKQLRKTISRIQETLAGHEAERMLSAAPSIDGVRVVVQSLDGWDAAGLKAMASALTNQSGVAAALFTRGDPIAAVIARSPDVGHDASTVLRALLDRFGGRGGGKPDLAQGGGLAGGAEEILSAARELLTRRSG
jgi:alanyl-tRNA synthetase